MLAISRPVIRSTPSAQDDRHSRQGMPIPEDDTRKDDPVVVHHHLELEGAQ